MPLSVLSHPLRAVTLKRDVCPRDPKRLHKNTYIRGSGVWHGAHARHKHRIIVRVCRAVHPSMCVQLRTRFYALARARVALQQHIFAIVI